MTQNMLVQLENGDNITHQMQVTSSTVLGDGLAHSGSFQSSVLRRAASKIRHSIFALISA